MISDEIGGTAKYSPPYSTCSGGDLTLSSSNPDEPIVGMTKVVGGNTYLFVMADQGMGDTLDYLRGAESRVRVRQPTKAPDKAAPTLPLSFGEHRGGRMWL